MRQVESLLDDPEVLSFVAAPPAVLERIGRAELERIAISNQSHPLRQLRDTVRIAGFARRLGARCLHVHGLVRAPTGALAAAIARIPWTLTAHNLVPPDPRLPERAVLARTLPRAARCIAVSEAVARSLRGWIPDERIRVVRNGIDPAPFDAAPSKEDARRVLGWHSDQRIVLAVARLSPEKGLDRLAWLARQPGIRVVVAGDGPERSRLLAAGIELLGTRTDIPLLLAAADCVAVPSVSEGLGLAAVEALAAGRPVVATAVGGLPEVVDTEVGELVPEAADAERFGRTVLEVIDRPDRWEALGRRGKQRVQSRFDIHSMRAATRECWREAIG